MARRLLQARIDFMIDAPGPIRAKTILEQVAIESKNDLISSPRPCRSATYDDTVETSWRTRAWEVASAMAVTAQGYQVAFCVRSCLAATDDVVDL